MINEYDISCPEKRADKIGSFLPDGLVENQISLAGQLRRSFAEAGRVGDGAPGYFILTFGCQQNEADSQRLAGLCEAMGYRRVESMEEAELILVNTCAIREHAEKKALSIIGTCKHLKDRNPALIIGVAGCMVSQMHRANKLKMSYPYVSFTFDTGAIHQLPTLVADALDGKGRKFVHSDTFLIAEGLPIARQNKHMAWLSIMYGCNNFCSYCIVPYVRGRERSRRIGDILTEAKMLIESGAKDITLLGQNVNSYGKDLDEGYDFSDVLREVASLPGDFRIRFMTSHPKDASDKLIETIAACPKIVRHFHLPVQSGSDTILRRMNRRYTAGHYKALTDRLKAAVPEISITSDIIVGFPGETEEDFEATLDMLRYVQFDMIYSFIYSPRIGTPAAEMEQVPHEVSTARFERLLALQNAISAEKNNRFVGQTLRVLVEEVSKTDASMLTGRSDPVRPVHFPGDISMIGDFAEIKIEKATPFTLEGMPV